VLVESIGSQSVGRSLRYGVLLPRAYQRTTQRYPVVYLLHGLGGDFTQWLDHGIENGPWRDDAIIVLADVGNTWCFNWPDAANGERNRWEDFLVDELPAAVESAYRVDRDRQAIGGYSMGGCCAAMVALRHPGRFAAVGVLAGALDVPADLKAQLLAGEDIQIQHRERLSTKPDPAIGAPEFDTQDERTPRSLLPEDPAFYDAHDPFQLLAAVPDDASPYWFIACGRDDSMLPASERFAEALKARSIPYEFLVLPGGHDAKFLDKALPHMMASLIVDMLRQ
jgi:S-formylglutathione hydrolase FrmB